MRIVNLENSNRKITKSVGNFHVLEYIQDASVSPMNAIDEYFMSKMNVRRRQVVIDIDRDHSAVIQAGAMQW
ncbi:MAG: AIM24 family protein, partial [Clostridium sp.]|nr:AIM24 family protein [Clostridium sp.]